MGEGEKEKGHPHQDILGQYPNDILTQQLLIGEGGASFFQPAASRPQQIGGGYASISSMELRPENTVVESPHQAPGK